MGSMTEARPTTSRLARADPRPILVTGLVVGWLLLSGFGALRALAILGGAAATSALGTADPLARAAAVAPDLVTDETRQLLAQREKRASLERSLAIPLLFVATLGVVGAVALLRRRTWSRGALACVGLVALGLSVFHAARLVEIGSAPAADLLESEPEARNALALVRAAAAIAVALQSIPLIVAMGLLRHPIVREYVKAPGRDPSRSGSPDILLLIAGAALLAAAGAVIFSKSRSHAPPSGKTTSEASAPEPRETFEWSAQPIVFSPPPPVPWTRERHAEGGRKGVSFTRYAVPPSRVIVAEAVLKTPPATAAEILPEFRLTAEQFRSANSVTVGDPQRAEVAGLPAFQTDYTLKERSMQHRGREFYTVAGGHVFVFTFLGRESDLPVLENLVASVRFPGTGAPAEPADDAARSSVRENPREEEAAGGDGGPLTQLRVGEQRLSIRVPPGWERVDYGQRQEFRHGEARIVVVDAGQVPPGATPGEIDDRSVERALRLFDHDPRRWEIGARKRIRDGPREALVVDTRDPLSHTFHKRTILFENAGRLLVLGTAQGTVEETRVPLDELARSIRFPD